MSRKNPNGAGTIGRYNGRWVGRITLPDGRRKAVYGASFEETRLRLTAVQRDLDLGQMPPPDRLTVAAYLTRWLQDHVRPNRRPSTFAAYNGHVRNHLIPAFGRVRLTKLTPLHVERLMTTMQSDGASAATASRVRATLRVALSRAERQGLISRNVAALAEPPPERHAAVEPLTVAQAGHLLEAVRGDRLEALLVLALATGLRLGELLGLRWNDLSPDYSELTVRHAIQRIRGEGLRLVPPKTQRSRRTLPIPAVAAGALRTHRQRQTFERQQTGSEWFDSGAGGFIFATHTGRPFDVTYISSKWWPRVRQEAALPHVRFHDLRHATASFLIAEGAGLREVMEHLGHSDITLTANTYTHILPHVLKASADKLDGVLRQATGQGDRSPG